MAAGNTFIIDSSFVLSYLLPDESIDYVQSFFNELKVKETRLVTSSLLPFEVFNGLNLAIIRNRINPELAEELGRTFFGIPMEILEVDFSETFKLAREYKLTVYDAAYLYLSESEGLPLLTLDQKLADLTQHSKNAV